MACSDYALPMAINFAASLARPHPRQPRRPRGRDQLDGGDGVARGGGAHSVGLGTLRAYSTSVALRSRHEIEISKSAPRDPDFQGPVVTLKIEAVVHEMFVASASSMTEGGVVGNVNAAVSVVPSVILDLIVLRNRFFGPRRGGERLRGAVRHAANFVIPHAFRGLRITLCL